MKIKWLRGDNYVNIPDSIMFYRPFSDCHLSINKVSSQSRLYFPRYAWTGTHYANNNWLRADNTVNI